MLAKQSAISVSPRSPQLGFAKTTVINISPAPPKPEYHPYVIEAIKLMYAKAPDEFFIVENFIQILCFFLTDF